MADDWYYTKNGERQGPVSSTKLKKLATEGWLIPADLVWKAGMEKPTPASSVRGLFTNPLARRLSEPIAGISPASSRPRRTHEGGSPLENLSLRQVVAAGGAFIAALGIAFTAIERSPVGLAFTLGGLSLVATGLYVEVGQLLRQAIVNIGKASREAAERRQESKRLAVEKQRLDLEARKLAIANQTVPMTSVPPPGGNVVVINQSPVRRWSPGLAAVLSLFLPGLGQLYKGQIINAIVWFFLVSLGYIALILPGLILHLFCIVGALSGNPWTEGKTTVVRQ